MVEETHEQNNENFWGLMKWIVILILVVIVLIVSWKALSSTIGKIFGPVAALGDAASSLIKECTDKGWLSCGLGISIFIGSIVFVIYMFAKLFIGQKSGLIDTTTLEFDSITSGAAGTYPSKAFPYNFRLYAVNYNIFRVMSGMGGLAYSN